jgi:hypothetical protein
VTSAANFGEFQDLFYKTNSDVLAKDVKSCPFNPLCPNPDDKEQKYSILYADT